MPARSTLGDHSAAVPFSASTCATPNAAALRRMLPTLPASCSRSSTTVGTSARSGAPARPLDQRSRSSAGDSSVLSSLEQRVGQQQHALRLLGQLAQRRLRPGRFGHQHLLQRPAALPGRRAAGGRPRARAVRRRLPVGARVAQRAAHQHQAGCRASGSAAARPSWRGRRTARTGAKLRRCSAQAPCVAQRRQVLGRAGSPCGRQSRTAGSARAAPGTAGRGAPWPGSTRPRWPAPCASPLTMASRRHGQHRQPVAVDQHAGAAAGAGPRRRGAWPAAWPAGC